jgi:hypothetical protein
LSYLIILFVIALALAPLSHFVPTKQQRKVARMREYAAISGLFVEFREVPARSTSAGTTRSGNTTYYGKRVKATGLGPQKRIAWLWEGERWAGLSRRDPVPAELSSFPECVSAASADPDSCGIYWQEQGGEESIDQILLALDAMVASLYQ